MNATLLDLKSYQFNTAEEATIVDQSSSTKIVVSKGALIFSNGTVFNGSAKMKFAYLNHSISSHQNAMIGGYQGYLPNG